MKGCFLILMTALAFSICAETVQKNSAPFSFPPAAGVIGRFSVQSKDINFSYSLHSSVRSVVTLSWSLPVKADKGSISIFTLSGTKVKTIPIADQQGSVNLNLSNGAKLSNGVYFATLTYGMCKKNLQMFLSK